MVDFTPTCKANSKFRFGMDRNGARVENDRYSDQPLSEVARRLDVDLTTREGTTVENRVEQCYSQCGLTPAQLMAKACGSKKRK